MKKQVKKLLCVLLIAMLSLASVAMVACSKKKNSEVLPQPEDGEYYYTLNDIYTVTLDRGKATAFFVGFDAPKQGAYTRNGTSVQIAFEDGTATGALTGDELTLVYGGLEMRFLKKIIYTVNFDSGGGSEVAPVQVINGKTATKPDSPTRAGHTFVGWYVDREHKIPFTFEREPIRKDTTVYGRFVVTPPAQTEFVIKRVLGYGDAPDLPSESTIGGRLYNTVSDPERDGYVFKGWWVSMHESAQKLSYEYGEDIIFKADSTLFALWQPVRETFATLSVRADAITWEKLSISGTLTVTDPDGNVVQETIGASAERVYRYPFADAKPGEYVVSLSSGGQTVTRYFINKALDRVSHFTVSENNVLSFEPVANAQRYYITVKCGNPDHEHTHLALEDNKYTYSFINCPMQRGGIIFVITAEADGFADSVSTPFVFSLDLKPVTGLSVSVQTGNLVWDAVENAAGYLVTVNGGAPVTVTEPSFDLREYSGQLSIAVTPVREGYNSPDPVKFDFERKELSAPSLLTVTGTMLSWRNVDDATSYSVYINGNRFDTSDTRLNLVDVGFDFATGGYYELSVQARTATSFSEPSASLTARYGAMHPEITYKNNTVSWMPVIGVPGYMVRVGDGSAVPVSAGKTSQKIALPAKGENKIAVRATGADSGNSWVEITVVAHEITFSALAGMTIEPLYKAAGDDFSDMPQPVYPGYDFAGWYNTRDGAEGNGTKYELNTVFGGEDDLKLYAYWYAKTYNVALDYGESGEGQQTSAQITYQKDFTLPVPTVTDPTCVFLGWYATPDGSGLMYADAKGVCTMPWQLTDEKATLYAYYASGCLEFSVNDSGYAVKAGPMVGMVRELEIPAIYKGSKVNAIAEYGFKNCKTLTKVSVPDTVKTIPATAFDGCSNILSYEVRDAGEASPNYSAVNNALLYHNPITGYVELAFVPPTSAETYAVPEGVTRLSGRSLISVSVKNIIVPHTVTMIDENAFSSAVITSVTFTAAPDGTAEKPLEIKTGAFGSESTELTELNLPARLVSLGNAPHVLFAGSKKLAAINISGAYSGAAYSSRDGVLCSANGDTIIYCPTGKKGAYTVPNTVIYIEDNAFNGLGSGYGYSSADYNGITEITFHANVQKIGKSAFAECVNLTKAIFESSANHPPLIIGERAFYDCSNLTTLTFNEDGSMQTSGTADAPVFSYNATRKCGITEIGAYAFYGCNFSNVLLPSTLTKIGERAFEGNRALTDIDFSHARTDLNIAAYAFANCTEISSLNITDNVGVIAFPAVFAGCSKIGEFKVGNNPHYETDAQGVLYNKGKTAIVFYPDSAAAVYVLPQSITSIEDGAFLNKRLTEITIHGGVASIGASAFEGCRSLAKVTLQESAADGATLQIGDKAFYNCVKLQSITLPARTVKIGASSFASDGSSLLSSVKLNDGLDSIGEQAFYGNGAFGSITVPASVTSIGARAFGQSGVKSVTFTREAGKSASLELGDGVFAGSAVVSVILPEGLNRIPDETFRDCVSLTSVTVPSSVKNDGTTCGIGNRAFKGCVLLDTIEFTAGTDALSFGNYAFDGCARLTVLNLPARIAAMNKDKYDVFAMGGTSSQESYSAPNPNVYNAFYSEQSPRVLSCAIAEINVAAGGAQFASKDGILYTADLSTLVFCPQGKVGAVEVAKETTALRKTSFFNCAEITAVTFELGGDKDFKFASAKDNDLYDSAYATTENVFVNCAKLASIEFPARLALIGSYALQQIKKFPNGITSVTFADGCKLTGIGKAAFSGLDIESVILPENVGKVNNAGGVSSDVFKDCAALDTVTISKNLDEDSFNNIVASCPTIRHIVVPENSVNFSEENGIIYNKAKTSLLYVSFGAAADNLVIPSSVMKIADGTFKNVKGIKSVVFAADGNAQPLQIGKEAFAGSGIKSVTLPARLSSLGTAAFKGCADLTAVSFEKGFNYAAIPAEAFAGTGIIDIEIPSSVETLNESAFSDCADLAEVTFQSAKDSSGNDFYKLKRINAGVFRNCTSLTSVTLPGTVTRIGKEAFMGCTSLVSIGLPEELTLLGPKDDADTVDSGSFSNVFTNCSELAAVRLSAEMPYKPNGERNESVALAPLASTSLPSGVTAIGWRTFANCTSLTALGLNKVVSVFEKAFENSGIKTIDLSGVREFGDYAFSDCTSLGSITLGRRNAPAAGGIKLGNGVFARCGALVSVTLQDVVSIGGSAFSSTGLSSFDFALVMSIGNNAFGDCVNLQTAENIKVDLPRGVFSGCISLQNVRMNESVKNICENAFFGCTALQTLELPRQLTEIGTSAFEGCSALTQVNVESSVTSIGARAFFGCANADIEVAPAAESRTIGSEAFRESGIKAIDLAKTSFGYGTAVFMDSVSLESVVNLGVSTVYDNMFNGCTALETVTMTDGVTELRTHAFYNCRSLVNLTLSKKLQKISSIQRGAGWVFAGCSSLTQVTIPATVTTIGHYCFADCTNLAAVVYQGEPTSISPNAFNGCGNLTAVSGKDFEIEDGLIYRGTTLVSFGKNVVNAVVREGTTTLGTGAFQNCTTLESVVLPSSLTTLGDVRMFPVEVSSVFDGCTNLCEITLPIGVTEITPYAFRGCTSLIKVNMPGVKAVQPYAFDGCTNLQTVMMPQAETLYDYAFRNCKKLETVALPDTLSAIGYSLDSPYFCDGHVFEGCESLSSLQIPAKVKKLPANCFDGCVNLKSVTMAGVTNIGNFAFRDCKMLNDIDLKGVTSFGYGAFLQCESLTSVDISGASALSSVYSYGVFGGCANLQTLVTSAGAAIIRDGAVFSADNTLLMYIGAEENYTIPENTAAIGAGAFRYNATLKRVTVPLSVGRIPSYAFAETTALEEVILPATPMVIDIYAFENSGLITIDTEYVTEIGNSAFRGCARLRAIDTRNVTSIGNFAFADCTAMEDIRLTTKMTRVGANAFENWASPQKIYLVGISSYSGLSSWNSAWKKNCTAEIVRNAI